MYSNYYKLFWCNNRVHLSKSVQYDLSTDKIDKMDNWDKTLGKTIKFVKVLMIATERETGATEF